MSAFDKFQVALAEAVQAINKASIAAQQIEQELRADGHGYSSSVAEWSQCSTALDHMQSRIDQWQPKTTIKYGV